MSEAEAGDKPFGTVAIVGVGLIGGSLGMALRQSGLARTVVGVEPEWPRVWVARDAGAIDHGTTDWGKGTAGADLVVLSTPVGHILEMIRDVLAWVEPGTVVTDVGSTKSAIVKRAGDNPFFVGGHPMTGSEKIGVEAARADLFNGATWALTPTPHTDPHALALVERLAQTVGAKTLTLTADAHDAMTAVTSHLPHVLASSLMRQAAEMRETYHHAGRLSAGSFADATRVAASSPPLWRDVCLSNKDALFAALQHFRGQLDVLEAALEAGDGAALEAFFAQGRDAKADWEAGRMFPEQPPPFR